MGLVVTVVYLSLLLLSLDLTQRVVGSATSRKAALPLALVLAALYLAGAWWTRRLKVPRPDRVEHHRAALILAALVVTGLLLVLSPSPPLSFKLGQVPRIAGVVALSVALVGVPVYVGARWLSYSGWREREGPGNG